MHIAYDDLDIEKRKDSTIAGLEQGIERKKIERK